MVKIKFAGILKQHQPEADAEGFWVIDAAGRTIKEVLAETDLAKSIYHYHTIVNGTHVLRDYVLQDGDILNVPTTFMGG